NVHNYLHQAIEHALPAGSPAFNVLDVPLQVSFSELEEALHSGKFSICAPIQALCEAISYYCCDVLLITGRPGCLPGLQSLI
ncbi:virulence factor SrfB, partial [Cronobacter sakazakii]